MAAGQDGDERLLDHFVLAEDHLADRGLGRGHMRRGRFGGPHDHVFELFETISASNGHGYLLVFGPYSCTGGDPRQLHESTAGNIALLLGIHHAIYTPSRSEAELALILHPQGTQLGEQRPDAGWRSQNLE